MTDTADHEKHRCIYCGTFRPSSAFTTEHVVQSAFGRWRQSLTLPGSAHIVCADCNQWFGDNLDLAFTRDSYEAFLRLDNGAKRPEEIGDMFPSRVSVQLPDDSEFGPLKVALGPPGPGEDQTLPSLRLLPQVRVRSRAGGYVVLVERDMNQLVSRDDLELGQIAIFSSTQEEEDRIQLRLEELGLSLKNKRPIEGLAGAGVGEVTISLGAVFDQIVARAIAKIAFNYLAATEGAEYARRDDFEKVRRFIRHGEGSWREYVARTDEPILAFDTSRLRSTRGHLLTLSNSGGPNAEGIVGSVSLYNDLTYRVTLSRRTPGVWRRIRNGHHYNARTGRVEPLLDGSLLILPRPRYPIL